MAKSTQVTFLVGLYLIAMTIAFAFELYHTYSSLFPRVLSPFKNHPLLFAHVENALNQLNHWAIAWFLLSQGQVLGLLIARLLHKKQ